MYSYKSITSKRELLSYKNQILNLFKICFKRDLDERIWQWQYIDNPQGDPIVTLAFVEDILVAHFAFIPNLLLLKNKPMLVYQSITIMIDSRYSSLELFPNLGKINEEIAIHNNALAVYGYPNENAYRLFQRFFHWNIDINGAIVSSFFDKNSIKRYINCQNSHNSFRFNFENNEILNWRFSKPYADYTLSNGIITKKFENQYDLIYVFQDANLKNDEYTVYNHYIENCTEEFNKLFTYRFGYKILNSDYQNFNFCKDLILSDVF